MAKFDYDDIVLVSVEAPSQFQPGEKAWIIAIFEDRSAVGLSGHPLGTVYSVEFEGGAAIDIPEVWLSRFEEGAS